MAKAQRMSSKDLNTLLRISESISEAWTHIKDDEERLDGKIKAVRDAYETRGRGTFYQALEGTTRSTTEVDTRKQRRIRDHLLAILALLTHQDNLKLKAEQDPRYKRAYEMSKQNTANLEEAFWSLFPYLADAHNILTQMEKDLNTKLVQSQTFDVSNRMRKLKPLLDNKQAKKQVEDTRKSLEPPSDNKADLDDEDDDEEGEEQ